MPPSLLTLLLASVTSCAAVTFSSVPVLEYPFIYAHNAGTGYMASANGPFTRWGKNQQGTLGNQLECGARALDIRPHLKSDGNLVFGHGSLIVVEQDFSEAIQHVLDWSIANPTELVLLLFKGSNECKEGCPAEAEKQLRTLGFGDDQIVKDCSVLQGLTVGQAVTNGQVNGKGGGVLALFGPDFTACLNDNYDPSVQCEYTENSKAYSCLQNPYNEALTAPGQRLLEHVEKHTESALPAANNKLNSANAHWQIASESILKPSSILEYESVFGANQRASDWVQAGKLKHVNLLQVDNVCNNGLELQRSLHTYFNLTGVDVPTTYPVIVDGQEPDDETNEPGPETGDPRPSGDEGSGSRILAGYLGASGVAAAAVVMFV